MTYELVGHINDETLIELQNIVQAAQWKIVLDNEKDFKTWYATEQVRVLDEIYDNWKDIHSAFYLNIPPSGKVHRHIDSAHTWSTFHIPVHTNPQAVSWMLNGCEEPYYLVAGGIYSVNRQIEHWSVNNGRTDRIHLLVEAYD